MTVSWFKKTIDELAESTLIGLVRNKKSQGEDRSFPYQQFQIPTYRHAFCLNEERVY
jgi:hypothetical protein